MPRGLRSVDAGGDVRGANPVAVAVDDRREHSRIRRTGKLQCDHGAPGDRLGPREHHASCAGIVAARLRPRSLQRQASGGTLAAAMMPNNVTANKHSTRL